MTLQYPNYEKNVLTLQVLKQLLSQSDFEQFVSMRDGKQKITRELADKIASAMQAWALGHGATHYCHWFQPLNGATAEKHDSFIEYSGGAKVLNFSGNQLVKGETDASSFPSGGSRATFEARGYTVWDCTSPVFIKEIGKSKTLCIPTVFCSYSGVTLDEKTPLLRANQALSQNCSRVLRFFDVDPSEKIIINVGPEQEYFLIDSKQFNSRLDLKMCGRTLLGARCPKGQENQDHYFADIKPRVLDFMNEVNHELWKLGIPAKTQHNEVSPSQHEIAVLFSESHVSIDGNQLVMDILLKTATKHGMTCLLHEKPFDNLNGSGKHNNWSFGTKALNVLQPATSPDQTLRFVLFFMSVIAAVDKYQDLLFASVANAQNMHRLGGHEAPPAILSVYTGEELIEFIESFINNNDTPLNDDLTLSFQCLTLPVLSKDISDRNRTSPFAFTGNKFEFRMPGSGQSLGLCNCVIAGAVADILDQVAGKLESDSKLQNFSLLKSVRTIVSDLYQQHKRIIFNGNGYSDDWRKEAEKRGLRINSSVVSALQDINSEKNLSMFESLGILSNIELNLRKEVNLSNYINIIDIERNVMIDMVRQQVIPAVEQQLFDLLKLCNECDHKHLDLPYLNSKVELISKQLDQLGNHVTSLANCQANGGTIVDNARYYENIVLPLMDKVRKLSDDLELVVGKKYWPFPSYGDILFYE